MMSFGIRTSGSIAVKYGGQFCNMPSYNKVDFLKMSSIVSAVLNVTSDDT